MQVKTYGVNKTYPHQKTPQNKTKQTHRDTNKVNDHAYKDTRHDNKCGQRRQGKYSIKSTNPIWWKSTVVDKWLLRLYRPQKVVRGRKLK